MPLIEDPNTGEHRFVMPQNQSIGRDIYDLVNPRSRMPTIRTLGNNPFIEVDLGMDLGAAWAGVHYFRYTQSEGRGRFLQRGYIDDPEDSICFSDTDMVFDDREIGRHSFRIGAQTGPFMGSPAVGGRLYSASFQGITVISEVVINSGQLFSDVGGELAGPLISTVAGYARPAGSSYATCMENVQVVGTPTLWMGYDNGAPYSLQAITNLSPFTSTLIPTTPATTYGLCQTPVDGDSVQIYCMDASGRGIIKMLNTNVTLGSGTIYDRSFIPPGGYTVGQVNINPNPEVWYWVPSNGTAFFDGSAPGPLGFGCTYTEPNYRGKLLRVDLRAFSVYEVATSTPWVKYVTSGRFGVFYCDGRSHYYMSRGSDVPVRPAADLPLLSNRDRVCRGHWHKDDRFFWEENIPDMTSANTTWVIRYEYDVYTNRAFPISRTMVFTMTGLVSQGSPRLPVSTHNDNLLSFIGGEWVWQYQPPRGELGYAKRHIDGENILHGKYFEPQGFRTTPRMTHSRYPRALYRVCRVLGPHRANLRTGSGTEAGMDYDHSYCTVDILGHPQATFRASAAFEGQGKWDYANDDTWTPELQWTVRSYNDTTGAVPAKYTNNPWPIVTEGLMVEDGFSLPSPDAVRSLFGVLDAA